MTDTPIYDQIQWELRSEHTSSEQRSTTRTSRRQEDGGRVSVWALVDAHRRRA